MKKYIFLFAILALSINLGATQIGTKQIKDSAITTVKIDDSAVNDTKLEAILKAKIPSTDEKAAMTNASSPDAGNPFATISDITCADSGVQTVTGGDFITNSGTEDNPILDVDVDDALDVDTVLWTADKITTELATKIDDTDDVIKDTHIDWGTGASQVSAIDVPVEDTGAFFDDLEVETVLQKLGSQSALINGTTLRPVTLSITSDGSDITASLSSLVGTTITYKFSDGETVVDVTTPDTVLLTEGTDTIPVVNYVYVLQTDPTTLVSNTTGWPSATELCSVAKVICQSAVTLQADGPLKQHTWMDDIANDAKRGHLTHINSWIRDQWATWESGVAPSFSGTGTGTIGYASTSGKVRQLHKKTFPEFGDGCDLYCVDDPDTPYRKITNIADLLKDSSGDPLKDEAYALVFWGAMSDDGESKIFVNLPSCGERDENKAREDKKKCINYSIPENFRGVGFLIYRLVLKNNNDTTWTLYTAGSGDDLRGQFPNTGAGSSTAIGAEFPDGASGFTLFNVTDSTKEVQVDLSGITTGNTRTITFPDTDVDLGDIADKLNIADSTLFPLVDGTRPFTGNQDFQDGITVDTILESTVGDGVTIETVLIKDGLVGGRDVSVDGARIDELESTDTPVFASVNIGSVYQFPPVIGTAAQIMKVPAAGTILEWGSPAAGYTNLTEFVDQTAWRLFQSNADGDVTELAFGDAGSYVKSNGADTALVFDTPAGTGDVVGPAGAVDNNIATFDTATGKLIQDSGTLISDLVLMTDTGIWVAVAEKVNADSATWDGVVDKLDTADSTLFIWKDGSQDFTADQSLGGFSMTNSDEPTADSELATKYYVDNNSGSSVDYSYIYYVTGSSGSDANDGLNMEEGLASFGQGITLATAETPSDTNIFAIVCDNAEIYTEDLTIPSYVHVIAPSATINGNHIVSDSSSINIYKNTISTGSAFTKSDSGSSDITFEHLVISGNTSGVWVLSGKINLNFNTIENSGSGRGIIADTGDINFSGNYINVTGSGYGISNSGSTANIDGTLVRLEESGGSGTGIIVNAGTANLIISDVDCDDRAYYIWSSSTLNLIASTLSGTETNNGTANVVTSDIISDIAYDDTTWDSNTDGASKNAIRDKINPMDTAIALNTAKANPLTRYIHWSPAYNGYVLSADGSDNDGGDSGILVAFAGTLGDSANTDTPYMEWASTVALISDYDVIIRIPIPADYTSMGTMSVEYLSDTVQEDSATITLYDSNDTTDSSVILSSSTWAVDETIAPSGTYTAGEYMTIKAHLECSQNQSMRIGDIKCSYTATR